ncbi:MAG: ATP-binding protein [Candidatus Acidiferrum sp.]
MTALGKFIAMSGLPRSGKSTIAKKVYAPMGYTIVSPDDFRLTMFGQRWYGPGEPMLWAVIYATVDSLLQSGNRVILDATNLIADRRNPWVKRGAKFVVVDTPKEECIRRAKATNDDYILPVIERMAARYEPIEDWEDITIAAVHKWQSKET